MSKESSAKQYAVGASVTVVVFGLLVSGGFAGWKLNDALTHAPTTPTTSLAASQSPTTTTAIAGK